MRTLALTMLGAFIVVLVLLYYGPRWTVDGFYHDRGHKVDFWLKSNAMNYATKNENNYALVNLKDNWTNKNTLVINRWEEMYGDLVMVVDENGSFLRYENTKNEQVDPNHPDYKRIVEPKPAPPDKSSELRAFIDKTIANEGPFRDYKPFIARWVEQHWLELKRIMEGDGK